MHDLEQKRHQAARWAILRILNAGRPIGVSEAIIVRVLVDEKLASPSRTELRREMHYLRDLGLVAIVTSEGLDDDIVYVGKLTAAGVAVVEYTATAPAGVARPRKSARAA
jgi:hypothetical protein